MRRSGELVARLPRRRPGRSRRADGSSAAARPLRRAFALACGAATLGLACGEREPAPRGGESASPPERRLVEPEWQLLWQVGGTLQDTLLANAARIAADGTGVTLVDFRAGRVLRFTAAGDLLWSYGRRGRGPDELARPRDLKLDPHGRAWILDVENARLVVLSPEGRRVARISLEEVGYPPDDFVPLEDGGAVLLVLEPEHPIIRVDAAGRIVERRAFPWSGYSALHPLASQLITGNDPTSHRWVAAFQVGDGFFAFDGPRWLGTHAHFVEPIPFPAVEVHRSGSRFGRSERVTTLAEPEFSASSVALSPDRLYVLFTGRTAHKDRLIDTYDPSTGEYVESLLLPRPVAHIAYGAGTLYATYSDPYPTLVAWRAR
ncbi:MAG: hypothetical protein ACE5HP_12340 [Gemmatimonadota bacterium]